MKLLVMGAGALGGYFGGRLAAAGHDVAFVARGAHLAAMQKDGLRIESPRGDLYLPEVKAVADPADTGSAGVVLFMVKNYDVEGAAQAIKPVVGGSSVIVTLQNGVSAPERVRAILRKGQVVPGAAYFPADIKAPGVIRHSSLAQGLALGSGQGNAVGVVKHLVDALVNVGVDASIAENAEHLLWKKFMLVCATSAITTLTRLDLGPIRDTPETLVLLRQALDEAAAVAEAACPDLPKEAAQEQWEIVGTKLSQW